MEETYLTPEEKKQFLNSFRRLLELTKDVAQPGDTRRIKSIITDSIKENHYRRDRYGINPAVHNLETATALCEKISPDRNMVIAILLFNL